MDFGVLSRLLQRFLIGLDRFVIPFKLSQTVASVCENSAG
jgi:hypothetical protein